MQYTQKRMPTIILQNAEYTNLLEVTPITLVINTKYYEVDTATIVLPYDQWLNAVNTSKTLMASSYSHEWQRIRDERTKSPTFFHNLSTGDYYYISKIHYSEQNNKRIVTFDCFTEDLFLNYSVINPISLTDPNTQGRRGAVGNYCHKLMEDAQTGRASSFDIERRPLVLQGTFSYSGNMTSFNVEPYANMGETVRSMLKLHEAGIHMRGDTHKIDVFRGVDRTPFSGNNPIIFSQKFGNVYNVDIVTNKEHVRSVLIASAQFNGKHLETDTDTTALTIVTDSRTSEQGQVVDPQDFYIPYNLWETYKENLDMKLTQDQLNNMEANQFELLLANECSRQLHETCNLITNVSFDVIGNSYTFGEDFNIGDLCQIELETFGISQPMRVIDVMETWENNQYKVNYEFGNPLNQQSTY